MSPLAFDTLEYVHKLKEAGVPEKQAETHAHALTLVIDNNLVTKQDLKELKYELKSDMKDLRSDMKDLETSLRSDMKELRSEFKNDIKDLKNGDIKDLKHEMLLLKWMMGFILAGTLSLVLKAFF